MSLLSAKKRVLQPVAFIINFFRHITKKVRVSFLEVWVGQTCDLKCMHCCHLIPYVEPKVYDMNKTIHYCKKLLLLCNVEYFSIAGGEPFCNKQLYKLLDFVAKTDAISDGKIITNGTILPDEKTLRSIKALNGKLEVRIDQYPSHSEQAEKFYQLMLANNIRCHINRMKNSNESTTWRMVGGPFQQKLNTNFTQLLFSDCFVKTCSTMANGEISACPRGITSNLVYGVKKNNFEHINLDKIGNGVIARAKVATCFLPVCYMDYCGYCLSLSKMNPYNVVPGEQLTPELKKQVNEWKEKNKSKNNERKREN